MCWLGTKYNALSYKQSETQLWQAKHKQICNPTQLKSGSWADGRVNLSSSSSFSTSLFSFLWCWLYSLAGRKMVPLAWLTHPYKTATKGRKSIFSCSSFLRARKLYPEAPRILHVSPGPLLSHIFFPELISITREILDFYSTLGSWTKDERVFCQVF